ncbi:3'-5' exonuclease [Persephonella sp.]
MDFIKKLKFLKYKNNPYFKKFYREIKEKSLDKIVFTCFDLETTGLDVKKDEIISIGAVQIKGLKVDLSTGFYTVVKPEKKPEKDTILIHGITPSQLEDAPSAEEVIPEFLEYIRGTVLVGYFVTFDIQILSRYTLKMYNLPVLNPYIDLIELYQEKLSRSYVPVEKRKIKTLEELAEEYSVPVENRHNAFYDSLITALIFIAMVKKDRFTMEKYLSKIL